jgi:multisubunit Na+/H+ antiporter MnhE subunit
MTALWLLVGGVYAVDELVAGIGAGLVAALAAEVLRTRGLLRFDPEWTWVARGAVVLPRIVTEARDLAAALATRRGAYRAVEFPTGPADVGGAFRRAWIAVVGTLSPKAIVVDVDLERKLVLVHDVRPERPSSEPL